MEAGRFSLLLEHDVISFGKPEEVMEDFDSEYCFQLLLEKQKPICGTEALDRKLHYLENLIEHQLEELHSLAEYSRDANIAEALENCQPGGITSQHIQDIEKQLEVIHSSIGPTVITLPSLPQQEPPPKSPGVARVQDHSDAVPQTSRSTEPIVVRAPSLSSNSNVVQVNKVKPSPKSKKPHDTRQLEPQLESPNVSNISDNSMIIPELSRTIKLESIELNEPVSSTDKDSSHIEEVQLVPKPEKLSNPPQLEPQMELPVIIDNSVPENAKLPEPSSTTNSDTSHSTKDKESKLKKLKNAVQEEFNKKDNQDTIEKHPSKSKKSQTVSEKEPSVSKKRTSQFTIDDSSSKAKKPKKVSEKEPSASKSKRISQTVIDDGPSNAKKVKKLSEQKPSDPKIINAAVTDNSSSKAKKSMKFPEKEASVSNTKRASLSSPVSSDKSSSKAHKTKKPPDQKPSDSSFKRTSKCEINDGSSKGKKPKVPEKDPPVSKVRHTSIEKTSPKTKIPKKDSTDSKTKNSSKSVIDDTYSKAKKGKKLPEVESPISKRRSSQSVKDTSSSKAVKSKNTEPADSKSRRTSQPDKSSTSTESKRGKETKSSSVFKITDNSNKEKCNSVPGMCFI